MARLSTHDTAREIEIPAMQKAAEAPEMQNTVWNWT